MCITENICRCQDSNCTLQQPNLRSHPLSHTPPIIYALVQTFRKAQNFVSDQTIEEHLNKYFLICHLTEEYEIIHYKNIDTKCVVLKNQNEYFISVCNLLNEHD